MPLRSNLDRLRAPSLMDHLHLPGAADHMARAADISDFKNQDSSASVVAASLAWRGTLLNYERSRKITKVVHLSKNS